MANPTAGASSKVELKAKNTNAGKSKNAKNSSVVSFSEEKSQGGESGKSVAGTETKAIKNTQVQNSDVQKHPVAVNNNTVGGAGQQATDVTRKGAEAGEQTPQRKEREMDKVAQLQAQEKTGKSKNYSPSPITKKNSKELATIKVHREIADTMEDGAEYEITTGLKKQFDWKTDSCIVEVYDGGVVDGDIITVAFNNVEVLTRYTLVKKKYRFRLNLTEKVSKIEIFAENEGKSPPNTANILLTDGNRHYRIKAYNEIGESAEILLKRK